jgi:hypothetical protein
LRLPLRAVDAFYSARRISAGFTSTAWRSGARLASIAVRPTAPITAAIVSGSSGATPNMMPDSSEPIPRPSAVPIAIPTAASRPTRPRTSAPTCARCAPSAQCREVADAEPDVANDQEVEWFWLYRLDECLDFFSLQRREIRNSDAAIRDERLVPHGSANARDRHVESASAPSSAC